MPKMRRMSRGKAAPCPLSLLRMNGTMGDDVRFSHMAVRAPAPGVPRLLVIAGQAAACRRELFEFWDGPVPKRARRSRPRLPPVARAAALLAMLLGIVAAAGPGVVDPGYVPQPVVIVVDQGITMSGRGKKDVRFREVAGENQAALAELLGPHRPAVVCSTFDGGMGTKTEVGEFARVLKDWLAMAVENREALRGLVVEKLRQTRGPVVLISDQQLEVEDERLVQIWPSERVEDVGIVRLAARESAGGTSGGQVMVRVWNQSNRKARRCAWRREASRKRWRWTCRSRGDRGGSGIILWRWDHWGGS